MARIDGLPSLEVIEGFKGLIDFVSWRGIFYARKWPVTPRASLSEAHFERAKLFGEIVQAYSLLAGEVIAYYQEMAEGIPRTARDLHVAAVLGHLHERKPLGKTLVQEGLLISSGDITPLTVLDRDVPDCSIALTLQASDVVHLSAVFDTENVPNIFLGRIYRDATLLGEAHALSERQTSPTIGRDLPGAGTFTYKLTAARNVGSGGRCFQIWTRLLYQVWR